MERIALGRKEIDAIKDDPEDAIKNLRGRYPLLNEFFADDGALEARLEIIDEPYMGLNRPLRIYYGIEPRCNLSMPHVRSQRLPWGIQASNSENRGFHNAADCRCGNFSASIDRRRNRIKGSQIY